MPDARFAHAARCLAQTARELAQLGWTPATSSNFSARVDDTTIAITISGRDKGRLSEADFMQIDLDGQAIDSAARPSAEALLHTQVYRRFPEVGAVLHTHSLNQTVASRLHGGEGEIHIHGYELIKAFRGQSSHATSITIPVFANRQDMPMLARDVDRWMDSGATLPVYLIDGHGAYAWGADIAEARRHLDALEFLLACELDLRRLAP